MKAPFILFVRDYSKVNRNAPRCNVSIYWQKTSKGRYEQMFHKISNRIIRGCYKFESSDLSESAMETRYRKAVSYDIMLLTEEEVLRVIEHNFEQLL